MRRLEEAVLVRGGADRRDRSAPVVDIGSDDPCPGKGRPPAVLSVSLLPSESDILGEAPLRELHEFLGDRVRHCVDEELLLVVVRFPAFPTHRALHHQVQLNLQLVPQIGYGLEESYWLVQPSASRRVRAFTRVQCSLGASGYIQAQQASPPGVERPGCLGYGQR